VRQACEVGLEVLGYAGRAKDLERRLEAELQPALERGKARRRPARPLFLDTLLARSPQVPGERSRAGGRPPV
jgi:hypothetical protein